MQQFNGLGVILENRYYGDSFPYNTSSTDELVYLTTEQSMQNSFNIFVLVDKILEHWLTSL